MASSIVNHPVYRVTQFSSAFEIEEDTDFEI